MGAKSGFEIGLFLLKWIGLGLLITYAVSLLGRIGIAFGEYVIAVWEANGDRRELENSADLCAEAIKEFLLSVLELVIMLVAAWGVGRAMGALAKTKFGRRLGYDRLVQWINKRNQLETTSSRITTTQNLLQNIANKVNYTIPSKGPVRGTLKHVEFARQVKALNNPYLQTEVTYKHGRIVHTAQRVGLDLMLLSIIQMEQLKRYMI